MNLFRFAAAPAFRALCGAKQEEGHASKECWPFSMDYLAPIESSLFQADTAASGCTNLQGGFSYAHARQALGVLAKGWRGSPSITRCRRRRMARLLSQRRC